MTPGVDASSHSLVWRPRLGACLDAGGVTFRVWAPSWTRVELVLDPGLPSSRRRLLERSNDGTFIGTFHDVAAGDLYSYMLDGEGPFPDPASRCQPRGVHGPAAVVDPHAYAWSDHAWRGVPLSDAIIYELHVGTFTPEGTFAGVTERLPDLADLGVCLGIDEYRRDSRGSITPPACRLGRCRQPLHRRHVLAFLA